MKLKITSAIILFGSLSALGASYKFSPEKGKVTFLAKGKPALISIKGEGEGVSATLAEKGNTLSGEISFRLKSLRTGIELRDDHLKNKYLEIEKYPIATLTVSGLELPADLKKDFSFNGSLQLHGIDQPIAGIASIGGDAKTLLLTADFKIKLSQFRIEIPSFKGITVAEDVQIKAEVSIVRGEE